MNISERINNAVGELVDLIANKVGSDRAIHPETAIASAARLSGSFLLRSFNFDLDKFEIGNVLLSEEANEKGPILINILGNMLQNYGIIIDSDKLGKNNGDKPNLSFLESMSLIQQDAINIIESYDLNFEEAAHAAAMATAFIVRECSRNISCETGFNTAIFGFIEGTKTIPPYLFKK